MLKIRNPLSKQQSQGKYELLVVIEIPIDS